jgi:integrase
VRTAQLEGLAALGTFIQDRSKVETLLAALAARQSPGLMRGTLYALDDFAAYAVSAGWLASPAASALRPADKPKPNPQKPIHVYTEAECELLVSTARARGLRWWAFLATLEQSGRRVGEVLALEWSNLHLTAEVPCWSLPMTKTGTQNLMPLSRMLREDVFTDANVTELQEESRVGTQRQYGRDPAVYPFPWHYMNASARFGRHCRTLGVPNRGFHCFRHTYATRMIAKGTPLSAVASLLGHSDISTTSRLYDHTNALAFAGYID